MNLLFVTHYAGFYGANKSLLTLMTLLQERYGVKPLVLLPNNGFVCEKLEEKGIEYLVCPFYWWVNYNHGPFQWVLNKRKQLINYRVAKGICSKLKGRGIDLVYSNSVCVNIGFFIAKRLGLPHIWHFRESLMQYSLSLSKYLTRRILASPVNKRYVLTSDYMMAFYRQYLPENRMVRVYNGVDLPVGFSRSEENRMRDRLQVACVGVITKQKNQLELLKAQFLLHKRGIDIDTWFVGSANDIAYYESMKNYVVSNGLDGMVHFVGYSDRIFDELQQKNLGVVAAHDEAFGRVTIEYMLMKMPVVASRSGANPELIKPGVTGNLYNLGDVNALAYLIEEYVQHPELLANQGLCAAKDATERFSAINNAKMIYKQIVDAFE